MYNSICYLLLVLGVWQVLATNEICPNQLQDAVNSVLENCDSCQYSSWGVLFIFLFIYFCITFIFSYYIYLFI